MKGGRNLASREQLAGQEVRASLDQNSAPSKRERGPREGAAGTGLAVITS